MLKLLTEAIVKKLKTDGKAWKWCWACERKGKKRWIRAEYICISCHNVYCKDDAIGIGCACEADD